MFPQGLGFQYIWIDALCIIQGDSLDWEEQSAAMMAIYHGCSLNIAIADAPNCSSGISHVLGVSSSAKIMKAMFPRHRDTPLETSWVFQETLVSVSSVYITDEGLAWDFCSEVCAQRGKPGTASQWAHPSDDMTPKATWADRSYISRFSPVATEDMDILQI